MKSTKQIGKKIIACLCAAAVMFTAVPTGARVEAASKSEMAKKAYAKKLEKMKPTSGQAIEFGMVDLDKDGVPELFAYDTDGGFIYNGGVYTYTKGKVKLVGSIFGNYCEIYPSSKVVSTCCKVSAGMYGYSYYKYDGKKLKLVLEKNTEDGSEEYYVGSKQISKQEFDKRYKALKLKKPTNIKMHKNTASNRRKYLK